MRAESVNCNGGMSTKKVLPTVELRSTSGRSVEVVMVVSVSRLCVSVCFAREGLLIDEGIGFQRRLPLSSQSNCF